MVEGIGSTPNLNLGIIQWCTSSPWEPTRPYQQPWPLENEILPAVTCLSETSVPTHVTPCIAPEDDSIERCHPENLRTDICADKHGGCVGSLVRKLRKAFGRDRQKYGRTCSQCTSNCKWKHAVNPDLELRRTELTSCMTFAPSRSWKESIPQNRTFPCIFGRATAKVHLPPAPAERITFFYGWTAPVGPDLLIVEVSRSHSAHHSR